MNTVTGASAFALMVLAPMGHARSLVPQSAGVLVAGLLMSIFYGEGLMRHYKISRAQLVLTDIFLHVLPFVVAYMQPPGGSLELSALLPVVIAAVSVGTDPRQAYPGVPLWIYIVYFFTLAFFLHSQYNAPQDTSSGRR